MVRRTRRRWSRRWFSLEDPTRLEPAERELYVETDVDGLVLRGYVDRLDVAPTGAMRVVDYKTGRSPSELFEGKALFQMKFYALVLWRLRGEIPRMLQLVYLGNGEIVRYAPDEHDLLGTERKLKACGSAIEQAATTGDWRPEHEPAVRLVRPPRPLPRLGRHAPSAARGRGPARAQPALVRRGRPRGGLSSRRFVDAGSARLTAPRRLSRLSGRRSRLVGLAAAALDDRDSVCGCLFLPALRTGRIERMFEVPVGEVAGADVAALAATLLALSERICWAQTSRPPRRSWRRPSG